MQTPTGRFALEGTTMTGAFRLFGRFDSSDEAEQFAASIRVPLKRLHIYDHLTRTTEPLDIRSFAF